MSVILEKKTGAAPNNQSISSPVLNCDEDELKNRIRTCVFDSYCDRSMKDEILRQAVNDCGFRANKAEILIDFELELCGIVNEEKLLSELDAILHQFTDKDKKLDNKELNDSIQYVCKVRSGYSTGLNYEVAQKYIVDFCRANSVKIKVGLFKWSIP